MTTINKGLGCKRSSFDHRDALYAFQPAPHLMTISVDSDLSSGIDWVYDQGHEESCVAHAISSNIRYIMKNQANTIVMPSRNFVYWNSRANDNPPTTSADNGTEIRSGLQGVSNTGSGFCPETMWGYQQSTVLVQPPPPCYAAANGNVIGTYRAVSQDRQTIQAALNGKQCIIFAIEVFSSMMTEEVARNGGVVPLPSDDDKVLGGHAILMVGANNTSQHYKFLNSWGEEWGDKGYGYLPFRFVESSYTASDFFVVDSVSLSATTPAGAPMNESWWQVLEDDFKKWV